MKHLLLIEDNLEMRENTQEILELANYTVTTSENGKIGVAKAKEILPDLIICDVMMPELDGYGVLYLLGCDRQTTAIPFIFLTAKADKSDFRKGMNLGADDYITKPFEEMELLSAIESRLNRSEKFKVEFEQNIKGVSNFIDEARGLEELKKLSENKKINTFKKKEKIFHEGDFALSVFLINKGKVRAYRINDDGKEYSTDMFNEGDFFGYMPILEGTEHYDTAEALEQTEVLKIPREDFLDLIRKNRDVSARFIKMLAHNVVEKEQKLLGLAYDSVRKRVADALVGLEKKYRNKNEDHFDITIVRSDLASIVGTSSETVIRTLSDFKQEQLISVKGSSISILNLEGLAHLRF